MELRHLRYFIAVADRLSFRQAAKFLRIAQPPLSVQIQKLEQELGTPLFTRANRQVLLTPAGHTLLTEARDIVERADRAVLKIQDEAAGREGSLKLAFKSGALSESITKGLRKFFRSHRGLRISLVPQESEDHGDADALISDYLPSELPPHAIPLQTAIPQLAVPPKHRLADRDDFLPADLIGETVFRPVPGNLSAPERFLMPSIEALASVTLVTVADSLQQRFWRVSLGLGTCLCGSADRGALDAKRIPLGGDAPSLVIAIVPNPNSQAGCLPLLVESIRQ
ncbi:MAG TPA: LysR family transcriptional regulator [Chthoniobacterales bacterium]